jgi:hypothetical protein
VSETESTARAEKTGVTLDALLVEAAAYLARAEAGALGSAEATAAEAIDIYRSVAGIRKQADEMFDQVQGRAKELLSEIIVETGKTEWSTDFGKAYIPKPSISARYDTKALDALCASDPELAARLAPHRIESERAGSLTIR